MAILSNASRAPFGAITVYRAVSTVEHAIKGLVAWNRARNAANALSRLTDRELDDIGLVRGDIARIAQDMSARV